MPITAMEKTVRDILLDNHMRKNGKIDRLRELQSEARAIQRAGSESSMSADDGLQDDLRVIEKALHDLHADTKEKGAATL
ncbi:hypothetical protein HGP16_18115 [Rhizobium sp. P40RR-XXII]|uniref:hypothetical protein n=1 Tax=unclassified Rhizobium TaxID=2613769 RepID=UPI0014567DCD|nr:MULTISPECIES: hypothetical protein [unclassified Rhizobium]NLR87818.1 hypothetical protein [Rhizobium sp. P28RR-XV]NLS18478.1 hypothetical protein [Rhizobium sp. P40RR-XXII]